MQGWLIAFGLVLIGLLVALVVLGALMNSKMTKMCSTSDEIAANAKEAQTKIELANAKLATVLTPLAMQAAAAQQQQPPSDPQQPPPPPPPLQTTNL